MSKINLHLSASLTRFRQHIVEYGSRAAKYLQSLDPKQWINNLKDNGLGLYLLAFLIPFAVRLIPEVIAWPYPLGFDTLIYADRMLQGTYLTLGAADLLKSTSLLWVIATVVGRLLGDVVLAVKVLGPVLFSLLCGLLTVYSRKVLGWNWWKALLLSVLAGTYFISLRISWEMYRQMLGFIFLMVGLTTLRISNVKWRWSIVAVSGFLVVWSHELAAVLYFAIVATHILMERNKGVQSKIFLALTATPGFLLFMYQGYSPARVLVPYNNVVTSSPMALASFVTGFLSYMFLPILPLAVLGALSFRELDVWSWLTICLGFSYWPIFLPEYSKFWFRWAILLVYRVVFLAVEGIDRLWKWGRRFVWKFNIGKVLVLSLLLVNLAMSGYYLTSVPEHQIQYFGEWNHYKQFIQTSMLQNSVSLSDTPEVVEALEWLGERAETDSVLLLHEAMDNWARILVSGVEIIRVDEVELSSQVRENAATCLIQLAEEKADNGSRVYTVWWVEGGGGYNMPQLPSQFNEIQNFKTISVFQYRK